MTNLEILVAPHIVDLTYVIVQSLQHGTLTPFHLRQAMTLAYRNGWTTGKMKGLDRGLQELAKVVTA